MVLIEKDVAKSCGYLCSGIGCSDLRHYEAEPIPVNIDNFDLRIVAEVFAQFGDIYVHGATIEVGV
jgi:hypothetical protein